MQRIALSACNTFQAHGLTSFMQFLIQSLMKACSGSRMKQTVAWTFEPSFEPLCHSMLNQLNQLNQLLSLPPISPNRSESVRIGPNRSYRFHQRIDVSATPLVRTSLQIRAPMNWWKLESVTICYHHLPSPLKTWNSWNWELNERNWVALKPSVSKLLKWCSMHLRSFKHI